MHISIADLYIKICIPISIPNASEKPVKYGPRAQTQCDKNKLNVATCWLSNSMLADEEPTPIETLFINIEMWPSLQSYSSIHCRQKPVKSPLGTDKRLPATLKTCRTSKVDSDSITRLTNKVITSKNSLAVKNRPRMSVITSYDRRECDEA